MKQQLLKILVCPECKSELTCTVKEKEFNEIKEGNLHCKKCSLDYAIKSFIPRFVETDAYVDNFSFEWHTHRSTQLDSQTGTKESTENFKRITGFDLNDLVGKLVLDSGCGSGRYSEVAANAGAEVVAIDLSFAVDAAWTNLGKRKNVHILQADIFKLPFRNETFDYIFSLGVLHHTPDCKGAFMHLPPLLKKEGKISIFVYSKKAHFLATDVLRVATTRMDKKHLYSLCRTVVEPVYTLTKIPLIGFPFRAFISTHPSKEWRALDTFDWYSPKYQSKHSHDEVVAWFTEAGLTEIKKLDFPTAVTGRK